MKPKSIFSNWNIFERRVLSRGGLAIGLDFDGTLAAIVKDPGKAAMSARTRKALESLAEVCVRRPLAARRGGSAESGGGLTLLAVISGRSLPDLRRLVKIPGIVYSGNHGFEIDGPGIKFRHRKGLVLSKPLGRMARRLSRAMRNYPGCGVNNKRFSISVHYRNARPSDIPGIRRAVRRKAGTAAVFRILEGKKVYEIRPRLRWDKGDAFETILRRFGRGRLPVFIGDDVVDEGAFRKTIQMGGVAIRVRASGESRAPYYLSRQSSVRVFLEKILSLTRRL
ncbi:MAG: trehalose-phosphatase [Elusimicrobia bacterium]|nr:trehalose-phosphatase [Elusimicrobiota bacterium]